MSDIVARSHLRATQVQITFLTAAAAEKRMELTNLVFHVYKDEKKKIARYKKQKEKEERDRATTSAGNLVSVPGEIRPTLSELIAMHQRPINRHVYDSELTDAFDDFLARSNGVEPRPDLRNVDLASEAVPMWACSMCTFVNSDGRRCEMCGNRR